MSDLKTMIENAWDNRDSISPSTVSSDVKQAIIDALDLLDSGAARVAEKISGEWVVHQWLKKSSFTVVSYSRQPTNERRRKPVLRQSTT